MDQRTYRIIVIVLCAVILVGGALLVIQHFPAPAQPQTPTEGAKQTADFTLQDPDGNTLKLSDFFGKPIVLNFWASWCGPCKSEMPEFEEAYQTYGDDVHFLMVNLTDGVSETVETASSFLANQSYTFPVYFDVTQEAAYAYGITAIPMTCFIDANGILVDSHTGMLSGAQLESGIKAILPG